MNTRAKSAAQNPKKRAGVKRIALILLRIVVIIFQSFNFDFVDLDFFGDSDIK